MNEHRIERLFPQLVSSGYSITSPETTEYNCIAWAADDTEVCWWPDPFDLGYWPSEIPRKETLDVFKKTYELLGYVTCQDAKYEKGFEKIAIYIDSNDKPTHAARQLSSGKWTSKLGQLEDIEHETLEGVAGQQYGTVALIMKRPKN